MVLQKEYSCIIRPSREDGFILKSTALDFNSVLEGLVGDPAKGFHIEVFDMDLTCGALNVTSITQDGNTYILGGKWHVVLDLANERTNELLEHLKTLGFYYSKDDNSFMLDSRVLAKLKSALISAKKQQLRDLGQTPKGIVIAKLFVKVTNGDGKIHVGLEEALRNLVVSVKKPNDPITDIAFPDTLEDLINLDSDDSVTVVFKNGALVKPRKPRVKTVVTQTSIGVADAPDAEGDLPQPR